MEKALSPLPLERHPHLLVGIETADDAWDRITAGASLLQGYTGFIYGGGLWPKHIHDGIAQRLREGGFVSLHDAVGSAAKRERPPG